MFTKWYTYNSNSNTNNHIFSPLVTITRGTSPWWNSALEFMIYPMSDLLLFILTPSSICLVSGSWNVFVSLISNLGCSPLWWVRACLSRGLVVSSLSSWFPWRCSLLLVYSVRLVSPWYRLVFPFREQSKHCISYPIPPLVALRQTSLLLLSDMQTLQSSLPQFSLSMGADLQSNDFNGVPPCSTIFALTAPLLILLTSSATVFHFLRSLFLEVCCQGYRGRR